MAMIRIKGVRLNSSESLHEYDVHSHYEKYQQDGPKSVYFKNTLLRTNFEKCWRSGTFDLQVSKDFPTLVLPLQNDTRPDLKSSLPT